MSSSLEYRWFAARCLELERHAEDVRTRALLLQMAQISHRLADETDGANKGALEGASRMNTDEPDERYDA